VRESRYKIRSRVGPDTLAFASSAFALIAIATLLAIAPGLAFAQTDKSIALHVGGEVPNQLELGAADFSTLPRRTINVTDEAGAKISYEGVALIELLRRAGAPLGKELKGPNMALCVVARAFDGYRVVFALADLDPGLGDLDVIVADRRDGKPLDAHEGPLRMVVLGDKRHARWVKGLSAISVERVH
jgi:DMSO/TMAO reductase YedYZ molybdopterin-dependent catalytic subunit